MRTLTDSDICTKLKWSFSHSFHKPSDHLKTVVCSCSCVWTWWNAASVAAVWMVMMLARRCSDGTAGVLHNPSVWKALPLAAHFASAGLVFPIACLKLQAVPPKHTPKHIQNYAVYLMACICYDCVIAFCLLCWLTKRYKQATIGRQCTLSTLVFSTLKVMHQDRSDFLI